MLDFIWVDAAENQQMIIFRQVMQCLDDGIEPLVAPEKPEHPDQSASGRDVIEYRKLFSGCSAPNVRHFGGGQKRQRMVIHITHAVREFHLREVAAGMASPADSRCSRLYCTLIAIALAKLRFRISLKYSR